MSVLSIAPFTFCFIVLLTFTPTPSLAIDEVLGLDDRNFDICTGLVTPRAVKADEFVPNEDFYFCHPKIPNAYMKCVVGRPKASEGKIAHTEVLEERELVCGANAFFNTDKKACLPHPLSDCASKFVQHRPTDQQRLCDAYRLSRPTSYSAVASLICHDKEKQLFVVCPVNTASAVVVPCTNGTYFNQAQGKCTEDEEQSDCPIEWKEMERNALKAGEMRMPFPKCECICKAVLNETTKSVVFASHPDNAKKFLICFRSGEIKNGDCQEDLLWNDNLGNCHSTGFNKLVSDCKPDGPVIRTGQHEGNPDAAPIRTAHISARQRCECHRALKLTGKKVMYICDPDSLHRFLVCHGTTAVSQKCAAGNYWNADSDACGPYRKCDPWLCTALMPITTATRPTTTTISPATTTISPATTTVSPATTTVRPTLPPTTVRPPYCEYFYEFHPEKVNWYSARRICEANLGTLATIPDQLTQSLLRDRYGAAHKNKKVVWVGASDRNLEGNWRWVTGERFGFTNWYRNQPSMKRDEDCLGFNYYVKGEWSDEDCDQEKQFICQHLVCTK